MPEPFDKTDAALARKLAEITPPADLRARLLAIDTKPDVEEGVSGKWWVRGIIAAAAALVLALGVLGTWFHSNGEPISAATADLSRFLSGGFPLSMKTDNMAHVRDWLAANNPRHPVRIPERLAQHLPLGCRELAWRGHAGSLACFRMSGGQEAHLAIFPTKVFSDPPGAEPQVASAGAWTRAAWSKDGMTYLLFVPAGMDPMKELATAFFRQGKIASSNLRSTAWPVAKTSSAMARMASSDWT